MSRSRYVRSFGRPYFAAQQLALTGMGRTELPAFGVSSLELEFVLNAMPVQLATGDELHPLLSVVDYGVAPARDLLAIAVTPSGRIVGVNGSGDIQQTGAAYLRAGIWYYVVVAYDYGLSQWYSMIVNGTDVIPAGLPGTAAAPLLPTGFAQHVLFNGAAGRTRCECSISQARIFWSGPTNMLITYDLSADTSPTIAGDQNTWPTGGLFDPTLTLGWRDPSPAPALWGAVPADSEPRQAYARGYSTQFTRRTRVATKFWRRRVAWLS